MPRPTRSTLVWLTAATLALIDLFATFGGRTLIRIGKLLATYDWMPTALTLAAKTSLIPRVVADLLTLPLVFVLCFVTVVTYSRGTELRSTELSKPLVASSTLGLFALYCLFALPWGGLPSVVAAVPPIPLETLYFEFVAVSLAISLWGAFFHSTNKESTQDLTYPHTGTLLGAAFLFAGGVAVLASIDWVIAAITLVVALIRLGGSPRVTKIEPETKLVSSLSILRRTSLGFGIFYSVVTGLVLTANLVGLVDYGSDYVVYPIFWEIQPSVTMVTFVVVSVALGAAIAMLVGLLRVPYRIHAGPPLALGVVVALWLLTAGVTAVSSFFGTEWSAFGLTHSYVYPSVLATGLVGVESIRYYINNSRLYFLAILGFLITIGWFVWDTRPTAHLLFLEVALVAFWGGPLMEWCGWRFRALTKYSELY